MEMKFASQVVLVCRSEIEKTPKIVYPHEIAVLKELHGENRIELTSEKSPLGEQTLDLEAEYQRLLNEYQQPAGKPHPVVEVFNSFDGFVEAVQGEPKRRKAV